MTKDTCLNNTIMDFIRYSIFLSTVAVCIMDLTMENKLNFMHIFANLAVLYFIK